MLKNIYVVYIFAFLLKVLIGYNRYDNPDAKPNIIQVKLHSGSNTEYICCGIIPLLGI